jgi:isoamylase
MSLHATAAGQSFPIGATVASDGVNFCVYSKCAASIDLLLFDGAGDAEAAQTIRLDPDRNRTYHYWHVFVQGIGAGQIYGYRVAGPNRPEEGMRFDPNKLLVDPYALAVANTEKYDRTKAIEPGDNATWAMKSVVVDPTQYNWEGDVPIQRPFVDAVIYEMHVAGFTRNPNSGVAPALRGTYAGLIQKIPYLQKLGIETVELMPIQQFDAQAAPVHTNYWGYQPVAWFAPHRAYSSQTDPLSPVNEFRDLVKALHRAGIEVILDVVFNHTAEGNAEGPVLSMRGLDNPAYYILDPADRAQYIDDTGCGNTINGNNTVVRRMILDCLRHWVEHMHVDGFRFDLAASLSRDELGRPVDRPPILLDIEADPVLAGTKIIAEAWDAAGLYQVGNFAGDRWAVWNGKFRDNVRRFVKSDAGMVGALAECLTGSPDLFHQSCRDPSRSINFLTAHDGFTLNDLVSYNDKHNEANGENNADGANDNNSWNCGIEGVSQDASVEALRSRQIKNFLTILLISDGQPMLLMGDEVRRSQRGNNNAYCQDNAIAWFDWDDVERNADMLRFTRGLIEFHQRSELFHGRTFWNQPGAARITWHGVHLNQPDWGEGSRSLAFELAQPQSEEQIFVMLNAYWEPLEFELPALPAGQPWHRLVDTALASPQDFSDPPQTLPADVHEYRCEARSTVILTRRSSIS